MREEDRKLIEEIADEPSLYPEKERKSREVRIKELTYWSDKYNEVNIYYNVYGMDLVETECIDDWLDRGVFRKQRHDINSTFCPYGSDFPYDYTLFMRDKEAFEKLMRSIFGTARVYVPSTGIIAGKNLSIRDKDTGTLIRTDVSGFFKHIDGKRAVFKNSFGYSGSNIIFADIYNGRVRYNGKDHSAEEFVDSIVKVNSTWIVQEVIKQHEWMNRVNRSSVNTLRILTYNTGARVVSGKSVLRFGLPGSEVDNCGKGGLYVAVDDDGVIGDMVFDPDRWWHKCDFAGEKIPFFKEAVNLVKTAHENIPLLFSIGWDVAIGFDGPLIIEGNDGWDPHSIQTPMGYAQRKTWDGYLKERETFYRDNIV